MNHLGRILQIGVHDDDGVTGGVVETRGDGSLVSKVPGEV